MDLSLLASPGYTAQLVSVLTEDLISKQTALDRLQRAALSAETTSELGSFRLREAEKKRDALAADLAQLRRLLHEERSSSKVCCIGTADA